MESSTAGLRHALRVLAKSPGFTAVAIAALALGIGANSAIFSLVDAVLLKPLPYPQPDRLVALHRRFPNGDSNSSSIPLFNLWHSQATAFEFVSASDFAGPGLNLSGLDRSEQIKGVHVSRDYFKLYGASTRLGRTFTAQEDSPGGVRAVVLSEGLWRRRFGGDASILGRGITLNGDSYTVVGVIDGRFVPDPPADAWLALRADPASRDQANYLSVTARLKPGITLSQANASLAVLAANFRKTAPSLFDKNESAAATPLAQSMTGDVRPALLILTGAVAFVLLIACANVANLLLARAAGRQRELAIRAALGAGRARIVRQLLTESLLLALAGALAGLALGRAGVRLLLAFSPGDIPRIDAAAGVPLDGNVVLFTAAAAVLTAVVFGLFPALQASRPDLNSTLKESSSRSGTGLRQNRVRGLLVASETTLAAVLLIGAGLLVRTFNGLRNVSTGIDSGHVLVMQTSLAGSRYATTAQIDALARNVTRRIEGLPGVTSASLAVVAPLANVGIDLPIVIPAHPPQPGSPFNGDEFWRFVGPHYFQVFGISRLRGRLFDETDTQSSLPVVIVSDAFARKYFPKEDPIGQRLVIGGKLLGPQFDDPPRQIVGIVGDVREGGLNRPFAPLMYIPQAQVGDGLTAFANSIIPMSWAVRTQGDPLAMTSLIERQFLAVDSQLPVAKVRTMDSLVHTLTARESFNTLLLGVFASIAMLLAAIGIYGLMSYSVEQRTNEVGIRIALGASRSDVLTMVVSQGMRLALAGVAIGLLASLGLARLLSKMLYGVKPADPVTFAFVGFALALVALAACVAPALRATRVDPIVALRYE